MPIELFLGPIKRPVVRVRALIFAPHRASSSYVPHIIELDEESSKLHHYTVRREFGQGAKIYNVFDESHPSTHINDRIFYFNRSRAVKGVYKMYDVNIEEPIAVIRAGLKSNFLLIRNDTNHFELGWHVVGHRVDALDGYKMFQLADGHTYQWTTKGKFMERVSNVGEKESEVRERVASVKILANKGFEIQVDEAKVPRDVAITTAMISLLDQWNTMYGFGGIYGGYQPRQISWKRG